MMMMMTAEFGCGWWAVSIGNGYRVPPHTLASGWPHHNIIIFKINSSLIPKKGNDKDKDKNALLTHHIGQFLDVFLLTFPLLTLLLPTYNKSTWLSRCTFQTLKWVISRSSSSLPPPKPWYEDPQHAGKLETTWSRHLPTANFNLMSLSSSTWPPRGIQAGQTSWWRKSCLVTKIRILWNAHFLSF